MNTKDINGKQIINYTIRFLILGVAVAAAYKITRDAIFLLEFGVMSRSGFSFTGLLKLLFELLVTGAIAKFGIQYSSKRVTKDKIEG